MSATKTGKPFDCVEFKREAQAEIYKEIKELTPEEQLEYFRKSARSGHLSEWWRAIKTTPARDPKERVVG
ncbi:MAG: hypothetical protein HZB55_20925 [Deltaproteobacteria bacterium]|nr:hypothetical protein [Deltaproteobacteria bacterium]